MALTLYMDVHVPRAITSGLRLRTVSVITAQEDGATQLDDPALLDRATALRCPLYTQDDDLLAEAHERQLTSRRFAGVIYSHQLRSPIGRCIEDLELIARACGPEALENRIEFIPF